MGKMRRKTYARAALFILILLLNSVTAGFGFCDQIEKARRTFEAYISALKSGNVKKAIEYLAEGQQKKYNVKKALKNVRRWNYKIIDSIEKDGYVRLLVFIEPSKVKKFVYLVQKDNKFLIIGPCQLFTKDWKVEETKYLIYHYPPSKSFRQVGNAIKELNSFCEKVKRFLRISLKEKVNYYWASSVDQVELFSGFPNFKAHGFSWGGYLAVSVSPDDKYQLFKAIEEAESKNKFLQSGLFVHLLDQRIVSGYPYDFWVKNELKEFSPALLVSRILSFEKRELLPFPTLGLEFDVGWYSAGSFVNYLIRSYGREKFIRLYYYENNLSHTAKNIYGISFSKLVNNWLKCLLKFETDLEAVKLDTTITSHYFIVHSSEYKELISEIKNEIDDSYESICSDLGYNFSDKVKVHFLLREDAVRLYGSKDTISISEVFKRKNVSNVDFSRHGLLGTIRDNEIYLLNLFERDRVISGFAHELTHLITQNLISEYPHRYYSTWKWLMEGIAYYEANQWRFLVAEGGRNFLAWLEPEQLVSLTDSHWKVDAGAIVLYQVAYSVIEYIVKKYGKRGIRKLLDVMAMNIPYEQTFQKAFGISNDRFDKQWKEYLRKKYHSYE